MDESTVGEKSMQDIEGEIDALKAQLVDGISEKERASMEQKIKDLQDELNVLLLKVDQAARRAAGLDPENPYPY